MSTNRKIPSVLIHGVKYIYCTPEISIKDVNTVSKYEFGKIQYCSANVCSICLRIMLRRLDKWSIHWHMFGSVFEL